MRICLYDQYLPPIARSTPSLRASPKKYQELLERELNRTILPSVHVSGLSLRMGRGFF